MSIKNKNDDDDEIGIFGKMGKWFFGTKKRPTGDYYEKLSQRFDEVWDLASSTYNTNKKINIIVVVIGITLISYGLIFQWYDTFFNIPSTSSTNNTTDNQANVTSKDSNSGNQQNIPNLTGLISSGTGLATIVGLFFFRSQAHIQRAFTNLALTNMIFTANSWSFERLDWLIWLKYNVPLMDKNDPRFPKGDISSVQNIDISEFTGIVRSVKDLTNEYSTELYERTRLMDELREEEKKEKKKGDIVSNDKGADDNKTPATQ